jgi:hypothetical protein
MVTQQESIARSQLRALTQGVRVFVLEPGYRYCVPSCSTDGTAYEVRVHEDDDISCNCPAGQHGRACKHIGAVILYIDAEVKLAAATAPQAQLEWTAEDEAKLADLF